MLMFYRPCKVYFLCSRSFIGGLRDIYLISLLYFTKVKLYNHLHGSDFKIYIENLPYFYRVFVKLLYRRVDQHAVLINGMEEQLSNVAKPNQIKVIPNFYEQTSVNISERNSSKNKIIKLVFLSSIVKTKGILELVRAYKILKKKGFDIHLTICGCFMTDEEMKSTELEKEFHSLIKNDDGISYLGGVDKDKKYEVLQDSDIFVLPSYYRSEAVPLSIIEAMASGCAVITSDYRYLPQLIEPRVNGDLVKPKSVDDLVCKLERLLKDDLLLNRISKVNKETAENMYSEDKYQHNIRNFLKD